MKGQVEAFIGKQKKKLKRIVEAYPKKKSLHLDFMELEKFDRKLAEQLLAEPDEILSLFQEVLAATDFPSLVEQPAINIRFINLPKDKGYTLLIRSLTAEYINHYVSVEGLVNRISDVLPKVDVAHFICNRCGHVEEVEQGAKHGLKEPGNCAGCQKRDFRFDPESSQWVDVQFVQVQEPLELLKGGEQARKIEVFLQDDLVDQVTAGDKVVVNGVVRLRHPKTKGAVYNKFLDANFIEGLEQEFEDIEITPEEEKEIIKLSKDPRLFDNIVASIAPSIYGYNEIKEAIALQLFGGTPRARQPDGTSIRNDIHLLLIGDPGVAKSQMLQYVNEIAPKGIYVTGKGTTGAGLTATAEKDEFAEGAWTLKAGALVLAGGGIAMIDEFDKMSKEDRSAMHEAMEQQTISVAKAGIVAKFKANTSVLAASNPKFSRFDSYKPLPEQFDIPPTLLSRFDLIFPIRDILDREQDRNIAKHMLKKYQSGKKHESILPALDTDLFRKYIAYSRMNIKAELTDAAGERIEEYYVKLRGMSAGGGASATPRQLDALVRLSEASAKARLSKDVSIDDVERAIKLTEFVLREIAYDHNTGEFDIDRVVTDHSKSARDSIRHIEEIIRHIVAESPDQHASFDEIIEQAGAQNIENFKAEKILQELKNKGIIYEPRHGKFSLTE